MKQEVYSEKINIFIIKFFINLIIYFYVNSIYRILGRKYIKFMMLEILKKNQKSLFFLLKSIKNKKKKYFGQFLQVA